MSQRFGLARFGLARLNGLVRHDSACPDGEACCELASRSGMAGLVWARHNGKVWVGKFGHGASPWMGLGRPEPGGIGEDRHVGLEWRGKESHDGVAREGSSSRG